MELFLVIAWSVIGVIAMCGKQVSTLTYCMTWLMLMLYLIKDMVGV